MFLDSQDKNGAIILKPLGFAKNKIAKPTLPGWKDISTDIVIAKKFAPGLDGIDIKPYTPQYDQVDKPRVPGWVNKLVF